MELNYTKIAGIDYGSKLAGTTVIACLNEQHNLQFAASQKNQDADLFILTWVRQHQPDFLFLDAPLSLPGVYQNIPDYSDYFYRVADKAVRAMSPMFLGGLTARAMKLQADLQSLGVHTIEVYPSHLAKVLGLDRTLYKKHKSYIPDIFSQIADGLLSFDPEFLSDATWHHVDALLALRSGMRYLNREHLIFGDALEGLMIV